MLRYLIFYGLKFQLDFICLCFAPHDITVIMWFWLVVVREKSTSTGRTVGQEIAESVFHFFNIHRYTVQLVNK